ncbi:nucleotidyltransferase domain-containing protein [Fimbriimonas ginsengisoli]|uniref:Polymerase nucleotidyl transferase domain-containing protein n=1 Tax=Fimbriimonas ginsengisoli Gsoil 348 TaxID=661478 RepID=A0A068NMP5_FIMGI|nr:nucleotidyltransferase domain-containing protein [Fimbriimonas ginsengisoli]AIE84731.1 hypothetical protein OP10G_1363 [Fimbriimonas ginsengisoli Gsoil 348]
MSGSPTTPHETLHRILGILAADPSVEGVFIGGSFARGEEDEVSDLDLWIVGAKWSPESLGSIFLTAEVKQMGGVPFLHGVSVGGTILDILFGPPAWDHYVPLELPEPTPVLPAPLPGYGLVEEFWLMSLKHRKSLWRGRHGILTYGLHHDRRYLLRAWALYDSGVDPMDQVFTIFALKSLYDKHIDERRLELLGLPLRNLEEILAATQAYRDEMSRLFPDPTPLEIAVRSLPLVPSSFT